MTMMSTSNKARRRLAVAILAAGLAVGSMAAFAASGLGGATAAASSRTGTATSATPTTTTGAPSPGGAQHGRYGRDGDFDGYGGHGRGGGLRVTRVSGNTITATGRGGQTVTVQVSATTVYTEAGASASLADVKVGSRIAVQSSPANTGGTTINATGVTILLPTEAGVVTNVSGTRLTITSVDGVTRTVTVSGSTRYQKAGQTAALSDIAAGTAIVAEGTTNSDGSLSAMRVTIQVPRIAGQVTAVNGSSYTVTGRNGTSYTIVTSSSSTFANANASAATAAAVKAGTVIAAEGTLSSDGKTLTALRVTIMPAGTDNGFGRHGGHGDADGDGASGPAQGSSSTSTTTTTTPSA